MKVLQLHYRKDKWSETSVEPSFNAQLCQLVIVFGSQETVVKSELFAYVKGKFPKANILLSSTAGEILSDSVYEDTAVVTAIEFEKTTLRSCKTNIKNHSNSFEAGKFLMQELNAQDLSGVFILSDGTQINGSELVEGISVNNKKNIPVTGGLAGDGTRFQKTVVGLNQLPEEGNLVAVGFYGDKVKIAHGSFGGWDEFGHEREITKSEKNVLHEIDGKNALDLYKKYLGSYKDELPGSAFMFPLSLRMKGSDENIIRTILMINEEEKSMLSAGNLPEGSKVRLMKGNFDHLIDGSSKAADNSLSMIGDAHPQLAILVSCVGRKIVLGERTDEEVQAAQNIFGPKTSITGFYSYGEISPCKPDTRCELHNQTMTITTFSELV